MLQVYSDVSAIKIRIHIRIRICIRIRFHVRRFLFQLSKYFRNLSQNVAPNAKGLCGLEREGGVGCTLPNEAFQLLLDYYYITTSECFIYIATNCCQRDGRRHSRCSLNGNDATWLSESKINFKN